MITTAPSPIPSPQILVNCLNQPDLAHLCHHHGRRFFVISDNCVSDLYQSRFESYFTHHALNVQWLRFAGGETSKSRAQKAELEDQLSDLGCDSHSVILAIGGGVVSDLAGFIAATYFRGIPIIYIPTTLLAMTDAAIGGKTAVNTPAGKNRIGVIRQPTAIVCDPLFLNTLPQTTRQEGLAESIKHALLRDGAFFDWIHDHHQAITALDQPTIGKLIRRSSAIKQAVIEQDLHQPGIRHQLNFGHTVAHALETLKGPTQSHGGAVCLGMLVEARCLVAVNRLNPNVVSALETQLTALKLRAQCPLSRQDIERLVHLCLRDKKNQNNTLFLVALSDVGTVDPDNLVAIDQRLFQDICDEFFSSP